MMFRDKHQTKAVISFMSFKTYFVQFSIMMFSLTYLNRCTEYYLQVFINTYAWNNVNILNGLEVVFIQIFCKIPKLFPQYENC